MRLNTSSELRFLLSEHTNDTSSDFVMNYSLVIFTDDVDTKFLFKESENGRTMTEGGGGGKAEVGDRTYNDVASLELKGFRLSTLCAEPFAIDKSTVGALHIFNVDLKKR